MRRFTVAGNLAGTTDEPIGVCVRHYGADGSVVVARSDVQEEQTLTIRINGIVAVQLVCSRSELAQLALGWLFTQGIVGSITDVERVDVNAQQMVVDVFLYEGRTIEPTEVLTGYRQLTTTTNSMSNEVDMLTLLAQPIQPIHCSSATVFALAIEFEKDKTSHARTKGSHSAYLAMQGRVLHVSEDIGRHNAFDKVIGFALINGIDLSQCMIMTSGRVPFDMIVKAIRSRVPILISKSVATDRTVDVARACGITLICEASCSSFKVLSGRVEPNLRRTVSNASPAA